jgi:enoyl-[acyl-carrier-protein] reductase (NADH)
VRSDQTAGPADEARASAHAADAAAPLLVVAGGHDEASLGWAAAAAWLERSAAHQVILTVRSRQAYDFAEAKRRELAGRIGVVEMDWTDERAPARLASHLDGAVGPRRAVAGAVHAVARADAANFTSPAHALDPAVYVGAFDACTVSLFRLVAGCRAHLAPYGGVVTFGFGEFGSVSEEYGGALSVAKLALAQAVVVLATSLGRETPPARTLEIVTGFIPTYGARGVAAGISRAQGRRVSAAEMARRFTDASPLAGTDADGQRAAAGELAVSFVSDAGLRHTTGERIHVDGGWTTTAKSTLPSLEAHCGGAAPSAGVRGR